jgi:hypothetical protein
MPGIAEPGKSSLEPSPIRQRPACGPIYFLNFTAYFFKKFNGLDDASSTPCIRKKKLDMSPISTDNTLSVYPRIQLLWWSEK